MRPPPLGLRLVTLAALVLVVPARAIAAPGPSIIDRNPHQIQRTGAILPNRLPIAPPSPVPNPNMIWTPLANDINAPFTQTTILILPGQPQDLVFELRHTSSIAHFTWHVFPFDLTAQFTGKPPGTLRSGDACIAGAKNICLGHTKITLHVRPRMSVVGTLGAGIPGPGYYGLLLIAKDDLGKATNLTRTFLVFPGSTGGAPLCNGCPPSR